MLVLRKQKNAPTDVNPSGSIFNNNEVDALGENRTHILSFGGLRAIRCTTSAYILATFILYDKICSIASKRVGFKMDHIGYAEGGKAVELF